MSRLCDETRLSRQTIHNNVGNCETVLLRSLSEYTAEMVRKARQAYPGIEGILFCMEGYAACAEYRATYISECIRFAFSQGEGGGGALYRHGVQELKGWLDTVQAHGEIRADVDVNDLARQLVLINSVNNYEWIFMGTTASDLQRQLPFRIRSALHGCASRLGQQRIEEYDCGLSKTVWSSGNLIN